eukprot:COSAG01_NODE_16073_length_1272_cov_6.940324_1_plen_205_part_00
MPAQRRSARSTAGQHRGRQTSAVSRPAPAVRRSRARGVGRSRSNPAPGQLTAATDEQASGEQPASIAGNASAATQAVRGDEQPLELTSSQREALLELDLGIVRRCRSLPRLRELCRERVVARRRFCGVIHHVFLSRPPRPLSARASTLPSDVAPAHTVCFFAQPSRPPPPLSARAPTPPSDVASHTPWCFLVFLVVPNSLSRSH